MTNLRAEAEEFERLFRNSEKLVASFTRIRKSDSVKPIKLSTSSPWLTGDLWKQYYTTLGLIVPNREAHSFIDLSFFLLLSNRDDKILHRVRYPLSKCTHRRGHSSFFVIAFNLSLHQSNTILPFKLNLIINLWLYMYYFIIGIK